MTATLFKSSSAHGIKIAFYVIIKHLFWFNDEVLTCMSTRPHLLNKKTVKYPKCFFISDGTAITAETLGKSLLSQFSDVEFDIQVIPYVDTPLFSA